MRFLMRSYSHLLIYDGVGSANADTAACVVKSILTSKMKIEAPL